MRRKLESSSSNLFRCRPQRNLATARPITYLRVVLKEQLLRGNFRSYPILWRTLWSSIGALAYLLGSFASGQSCQFAQIWANFSTAEFRSIGIFPTSAKVTWRRRQTACPLAHTLFTCKPYQANQQVQSGSRPTYLNSPLTTTSDTASLDEGSDWVAHIWLKSFERVIEREYLVCDETCLIGEIGGTLGFFLGGSILAFVDQLFYFIRKWLKLTYERPHLIATPVMEQAFTRLDT